ncbi:hypothetical protein HMPREF0731_4519, partial [Pseudoroseomonas cervicalis ATCC 49957]
KGRPRRSARCQARSARAWSAGWTMRESDCTAWSGARPVKSSTRGLT